MNSVLRLSRSLRVPGGVGKLCSKPACFRNEYLTCFSISPWLTAIPLSGSSFVFGHRSHTGAEDVQQSSADQLLQYWRGLLGTSAQHHTAKADPTQSTWKTKDMQDLLHAAIRVRHGRVSGVLPEQLLATFMQVYQKTMGSEDRRRLFLLVCQDFGVQGQHTSR